jgi:hypothetical protein
MVLPDIILMNTLDQPSPEINSRWMNGGLMGMKAAAIGFSGLMFNEKGR